MELRNSKFGSLSSASGSGDDLHPLLPRALRIPEVCMTSGLGRTTIYAAIKSGDLVARKYGRCTVVLADDLTEFLHNLPKTTSETDSA